MPQLAHGGDVGRKDEPVRPTLDGGCVVGRREGEDGFSAGEPYESSIRREILVGVEECGSIIQMERERFSEGEGPAHCTTGALCNPPSNPAGILK